MVKFNKAMNNKGVTLIELMVTMSITSIVLCLVLGIFFTGTKLYKYISDSTKIEQQGHFIMDFIVTKAMPSDGVSDVFDLNNASHYSKNDKIELKEIEFKDELLAKQEMHIFSIQKDDKVEGKSIRYGKSKTAKVELGNYIQRMQISPLPKESTYEHAKGIELNIELKKGNANIEVVKEIYFRK